MRAPITGTIISKSIERGTVIASATANVSGGTTLLQMADLNLVQVKALVDETDIGKVQPGQHATVTVDAFPNRPFDGTDAAVADLHEVEVELQPAGVAHSPGQKTLIAPGGAFNSVVIMRMVVVLPAPFGPSSPNTSPGVTSRSTPSTATVSPYRTRNPSTSSTLQNPAAARVQRSNHARAGEAAGGAGVSPADPP